MVHVYMGAVFPARPAFFSMITGTVDESSTFPLHPPLQVGGER